MSKFARKRKHINYIYSRINELHADIFHEASEIVNSERDLFIGDYMRESIGIKIALHKKYNRRLRLLEF